MDQRKGDLRIYIIIFLFLSCIISGGILLGLYLLLPNPNPLFLQAGMIFVAFPWFFWFLTFVYSYILKPCIISITKSVTNFDSEKGEEKNKNSQEVGDVETTVEKNSPRESEKHVQFGNVVVLGDEDVKEGSSNYLIQNHMRIAEEDKEEGDHEHGLR